MLARVRYCLVRELYTKVESDRFISEFLASATLTAQLPNVSFGVKLHNTSRLISPSQS